MLLIIDAEKSSDIQIKQPFETLGFASVKVLRSATQVHACVKELEQQAKLNTVSLIVINDNLDDADGYELCAELSRSPQIKNAYIIMIVSSRENKTAIEKTRISGAKQYAVKPYNAAAFHKQMLAYMLNKVVLVVEDDPVIVQLLRSILQKYYLELISVSDGFEANNLINHLLPVRFVMLDIGLPNINGLQLVKKIRVNQGWKKVPILMLTASTDASDVKKSLCAGANDYIAKPVKPAELIKRLHKYLPDVE